MRGGPRNLDSRISGQSATRLDIRKVTGCGFSTIRAYPAKYAVGDAVRVLYEADCPEQARIRSFHALWFICFLFGGLGLLFFAVGAGLLIFGV